MGELSDDADDGYILEVDFSYPRHLHDAHDDYALAPESLEIDRDMYSSAKQLVFPQTASQRKLTHNLSKVCGTPPQPEATGIHRVLAFKQSRWLKTYIEFQTHHRSLVRSSFLKDLFKLINNSVFGKTQENLRKRVQVELITDAGILRKRVAKPIFFRGNLITDYLTATQCIVAIQCNESTHLCGLFRARLVKAAHVQLSLQSHVRKILTSRSVATAIHGQG